MARGNQRDKAREATQKKLAAQVSPPRDHSSLPFCGLNFPGPGPEKKITLTLLSAQRAALGHALATPCPPGRLLPALAAGIKKQGMEEKKEGRAVVQALLTPSLANVQKSKNTKTGSEMQRDKEQAAAVMRQKQLAGKAQPPF